MATPISEIIETILIQNAIDIAAPIEIAFAAMLDEIGPESRLPDGTPMPFVLEAWPGGRWYRDLGNSKGHFWGHVQVIKAPTLLEICGPLMMSFPASNHVQYRFSAIETGTRLTFVHRGMGLIPAPMRDGLSQGWDQWNDKIRLRAERQKKR